MNVKELKAEISREQALPQADVIKSVCEMCEKEIELQSDNLCKKCYDSLPS